MAATDLRCADRLWHPWLRINRVLRVMLHTYWRRCVRCRAWIVPDFDKPASDQRSACLVCVPDAGR